METKTLNILRICDADILLDEIGPGQGKLIIASSYDHNFSYQWGAMGKDTTLKKFIKSCDDDYLINCLNRGDRGVFDGRKTMATVRGEYRREFPYKWYEFKEEQREVREIFREIEQCEDDREFIDLMQRLPDKIITDNYDFTEALEQFVQESWHHIVTGPSQATMFLKKIIKELKKKL